MNAVWSKTSHRRDSYNSAFRGQLARASKIDMSVGHKKLGQTDCHSESRSTSQVLLVPDEYCLGEDKDTVFKFYCKREGIFGRDINIVLRTTAYLTNYRVPTLMSN